MSRVNGLPTFLIIGAPKCGTTSLHRYLDEHPQIAMSREKELRYFIDEVEPCARLPSDPIDRQVIASSAAGRWKRGSAWYRRQFDSTAPIRGESSVGYASPWWGTAGRIARTLPDATILYCVRDPIERAISGYRFRHETGREPRSPDAALGRGCGVYVEESRYAANITPFLELFPAERIHFVESERLLNDRRATIAAVYGALGADASFWTHDLERRWNVTGARSGPRAVGSALHALRRRPWWQHVSSRAPAWVSKRTFSELKVEGDDRYAVSDATLAALRTALGEDTARLREITGRRFASWSL